MQEPVLKEPALVYVAINPIFAPAKTAAFTEKTLYALKKDLQGVPVIVWNEKVGVIIIRDGKIDVVLCGIFAIGKSVELGDVLHLLRHFRDVGVAVGGEYEERKVRVCLERGCQESDNLFRVYGTHRPFYLLARCAETAHGSVPPEILEIVMENVPGAYAAP